MGNEVFEHLRPKIRALAKRGARTRFFIIPVSLIWFQIVVLGAAVYAGFAFAGVELKKNAVDAVDTYFKNVQGGMTEQMLRERIRLIDESSRQLSGSAPLAQLRTNDAKIREVQAQLSKDLDGLSKALDRLRASSDADEHARRVKSAQMPLIRGATTRVAVGSPPEGALWFLRISDGTHDQRYCLVISRPDPTNGGAGTVNFLLKPEESDRTALPLSFSAASDGSLTIKTNQSASGTLTISYTVINASNASE